MSEKKVEDKNNDSEKKPTVPPIRIKPPTINVPKIEPPKVNIRPEVQKTIDNLLPSLTQNEWEYLIQRIRMFLQTNVKSPMLFGKESAEPDLLYKEMTEGLRELEEVVTVGYPKFTPLTEPKDNDTFGAIIDLVKPLFESPKVQDQFARILAALADKLEGKT
ncbi:MAG: hypothetical protein QXJ07_06485 [Candidatus Bathyarchaeia archaeon]